MNTLCTVVKSKSLVTQVFCQLRLKAVRIAASRPPIDVNDVMK